MATITTSTTLTVPELRERWLPHKERFNSTGSGHPTAVRFYRACSWLEEQGSRFAFCRTPCVSNNPHVIHCRRYLDTAMPYVRHSPGPRGIEEHLLNRGVAAAIYGRMGLAPTVRHLDGRCGSRPSVAMGSRGQQ